MPAGGSQGASTNSGFSRPRTTSSSGGSRFVLLINPTVPIYNDRSLVCLPTLFGHCSSVTELGFTTVAERIFRINSRVKLELGVSLFRQRYPDVDLLVIEPSPMESTLFLSGSMNFAERVQSLNFGYNSAARYFTEQYDMLKDCFARNGREVPLDEVPDGRGVQVKVLRVGLDDTDKEINAGEYETPPPGDDFLIIGHESLGIVEETGPAVTELNGCGRFFRNDLGRCLDVLDGPEGDDASMRPNQILAVSLPPRRGAWPRRSGPCTSPAINSVPAPGHVPRLDSFVPV